MESWWWNDETESTVREKKERLKIWKRTGEENDKVEYKTAKGKAKRVVARVKAEAIGLYDQLETVEGQQEIYRIAVTRDRSGKDICHIRNVKRNPFLIDENLIDECRLDECTWTSAG